MAGNVLTKYPAPVASVKFEYKITIAYLLIGGLWILFSDQLVGIMFNEPSVILKIQTLKGWFYVLLTGILFFLLLKHHLEKLRKAEQRARESDRLKTNFIQNISHEIRTPMNGIIGFTELMKEKNLTDAEKDEYLRIISDSSALLFNIVNEVLDISLIESGTQKVNYTKVSLNDLLDEVFLSFNTIVKNEIEFSAEYGAERGSDIIRADEVKIEQVLRNLISNSLKFVEKGYIKFGYRIKDGVVQFFVEDSGIGIKKDMQQHIFERFTKDDLEKTKVYEGVGLGLAICKGLVGMMGGNIELESEPGKGSVFSFSIPLILDEDKVEELKPGSFDAGSISRIPRLKVLVAEDNFPNQLYIREVLSRLGHNSILASDGNEAISLCRQTNDIDLVLMDIKMPFADGYEALREIRKFKSDLYIIAQTAYALNEREKALGEGFNDYIIKPFKAGQLAEAIDKFLAEGPKHPA